jgi:hypothetical protein
MGRGVAREAPVVLWALTLSLAVLGPGLALGYLLVRDMVWVPDLAMRSDFLGLGSGLPRAVPSDLVVAILDELVPGMLLQKLVLVAALAGGGVGATRLLDRDGVPAALWVRLLVVTVSCWNVYVAERLLMGQWPILVGYAVLPWLLVAGRRWRVDGTLPVRLFFLVPLGCLSASAGLVTAVALLAAASGKGRTLRAGLLVMAGNAPWVVSGLLHASSATSDGDAATVFALHAEGSVPPPLAALTLGGIWNSEVVPDSRSTVLGWLTLLAVLGVTALGARPWWRRTEPRERVSLLVCWTTGFGLAVLTWALPGLFAWAAVHIPGAGVVRDGARLLVLCAPLLVVLVAEGAMVLAQRAPSARPARVALFVAGLLLPVALLPDLAWGAAQRLQPADYPPAYREAREALSGRDGDVLVLPLSSYRAPHWNHGQPVLDPVGRYLIPDYVASDVLIVDGVPLEGEDPRVKEAADALALSTPAKRAAALAGIGIGAVVTDRTASGDAPEVAGVALVDDTELRVVGVDGLDPRELPFGWVLAMAIAWAAFAGLLVAAVWTTVVRRSSGVRR